MNDQPVTSAIDAEQPFIDSETGWNIPMAREMASSIRTADAANPNAWAIHLWKNEPFLAVGQVNVISIGPTEPFGYMVMSEDLSDDKFDWVNRYKTQKTYAGFPWATYLLIPPDAVERTIQLLQKAHEKAIQALASRVHSRSQRAAGHRPDYAETIGRITQTELPNPAYLRSPEPNQTRQGSASAFPYRSGRVDKVDTSLPMLQALFEANGLSYTATQIATFYTALQTKGLVVLSGISGTGKSKIAQGFVDTLPPSSIPLAIRPRFASTATLTIPERFADTKGFPRSNASAPISVTYGSTIASGLIRVRNNYSDNIVTQLITKGSTKELLEQLSPMTIVFADFSDWEAGMPTRVTLFDKAPSTSLFLAVRPDWRDSTSLLGYYNPLTETYEWTEFLRFLLRAKESFRQKDGLAWFVILDEMNLAHVEYYFADLLSIIESGRDEEGWSREAIRLTYPDTLTDNAPPHEIKLPPNLYIIGTVNMDETTHAFSPKVLDRAFTIELTEVSFADYPPVAATADAAAGTEMADEERQDLLRAFTRNGTFAQISKKEIRQAVDDHVEIRDWLESLNTRLARDQFHFGYRVFDEIAQFVYIADRNGMFPSDEPDLPADWLSAFDHAVYMKVLPKFNGSHARLHGPLTTLVDWSMNPEQPDWGWAVRHLSDTSDVKESLLRDAVLQRVATRAMRMLELLEANGFVSFG